MRRIKPVEVLFLFAFFSVMNSGVFCLEQEDIDRQNIINNLRSLLGLDSHSKGTTKIPSVNIGGYTSSMSPFYTPTTSSSTPTSNGVDKPQTANNTSIINSNETFTANASISNTNVANLTTSNNISTDITGVTNNISTNIIGVTDMTNDTDIGSIVNVTNTNFTDMANLTNTTTSDIVNSTDNTINAFNVSQIQESTNTPLGSSNFTTLNPNASFTTQETANGTRDETLNPTEYETLTTIASLVSHASVYSNNETIRQNDTGSTLLPNNSTLNPHCSVLPKFTNICLLSEEYKKQSESLTTFAEVENALADSYVQSCLQKYCYDGEWCLGDSMDAIINKTLSIPSKFCSSSFLSCLRSTADEYRTCDNYKKFKAVSDSLELVCKYRHVAKDAKGVESCGVHLVKLISVLLNGLKQKNTHTSDAEFSCFTQKGYLMVSFNCLLTQCPEMFVLILKEFDSWKWFTENRTLSYSCPVYYECVSSSSTTFWRRFSTTARTEYNMWHSTTAKTDQNYESLTTEREVINPFNGEIENEENLPTGSHPFGDTVAANSHIMASLSAMIVILTIGMSVLMVVCWRHLKKYTSRKRRGYSKLKTGEC